MFSTLSSRVEDVLVLGRIEILIRIGSVSFDSVIVGLVCCETRATVFFGKGTIFIKELGLSFRNKK